MKQQEHILKREMVAIGRTLYERGLVSSTGGNISMCNVGRVFITPGGKALGRLTPEMIVKTGLSGKVLEGGVPSKELSMHCAIYKVRKDVKAVVHTHSPYAIALSCMESPRSGNVLPPMTPGCVLRVGTLPLLKYFRPGSPELADSICKSVGQHNAVLLQNHGLVICGKNLEEAVNIAEETEENARIYILTNRKGRYLNPDEVEEINSVVKTQR